MNRPSALILAAGKGTRMKSRRPKVMQTLLGQPMLYYVLSALRDAGVSDVCVVVGYEGECVTSWLQKFWPSASVVWQKEQLGTGHAVMMASDWLSSRGDVVVVNGDMPMVTGDDFVRFFDGSDADWSFVTTQLADPTGYGRVIRSDSSVKVVEQKDASPQELACSEINVGIYRASGSDFLAGLASLRPNNSQKEYYIVDLISWALSQGRSVQPVLLPPENLCGVNDPMELARLNGLMRDRVNRRWMAQGAKLAEPLTTWISPASSFEGEVTLAPNVQLWGETELGDGCELGTGTVLTNCRLGKRVICRPYVVAQDSQAADDAVLGPFCFLREGSQLAQKALVGRFVELKKTCVGEGSKVPHLTYLGDTTVGSGSNIGAATVTCNYDGAKKHPTVIGNRCFIGSDTMLVAPVTVEDGATTAAGSVITSDVPADSLGIGRSRQVNIKGWRKQQKPHSDERKA
ncbi:bifunctional UDP-N-acetylglucosamine diphosphorylase/glucosamine-1-phosphate N-acetyltransferase GlmU [Jonquetella sp. BV3C21]|uniref:bifunctional UDP-N-acetylglucosamine diphosphorylase/glucosamine-1-phosphate N-acetyltransferase GlmU n=1 Tax=Jonquetella sp. BV3C21 TaxID=1111126 RepID=UPI0003ADA1D0|nr:bifunctional UDP-N-acetylglucosamine diphosphorylase/glucosamine-1-phosphate N-acetyltransferase GlmU [Jonquetella sp. BV3C21]ERL24717.1 UDP-N-acetylglucosamine diphosphorylase/glucosamine-1-phosphate N-acetyltransferase [Jonquetella sp. BV3C21]